MWTPDGLLMIGACSFLIGLRAGPGFLFWFGIITYGLSVYVRFGRYFGF